MKQEMLPEGISAFSIMSLATSKSLILSLSLTLYNIRPLINIYFIGNLNDPKQLAGVVLGYTVMNILYLTLAKGISDGSASMISQAYGAGKRVEVAIYLLRTLFVVTVLMMICAIVFSQLDHILMAIGFDDEISRIASHYSLCIVPGLWSISMFVVISRFLSCLFYFMAPVYTLLFTNVLHVILCHIFVENYGMEVNGVLLSTNITFIIDLILIICYCVFEKSVSEYFLSLQILDCRVVDNLSAFLAHTIPSALILMLRSCAMQSLVFISGWRSEAELNACSISLSILALTLNPAYALAQVYQ